MAAAQIVEPGPDTRDLARVSLEIHPPQHLGENGYAKIPSRMGASWPVCHDLVVWMRQELRHAPG